MRVHIAPAGLLAWAVGRPVEARVPSDVATCLACCSALRNTMLMPCRHAVLCEPCLNRLPLGPGGKTQCPMCRTAVISNQNVGVTTFRRRRPPLGFMRERERESHVVLKV